jgi:ferric iron reductase FhuF-like transporter/IucA/IucC family protein
VSRPTIRPAASPGHTLGPAQTRAVLHGLRPDLVDGYDAALPGARAAVLSRLLGALDREPLPGMTAHEPDRSGTASGARSAWPATPAYPPRQRDEGDSAHQAGRQRVSLADGRTVDFPTAAARPFAVAVPGLTAEIDGVAYDDPGALVRALWPQSASATDPAGLRDGQAGLRDGQAGFASEVDNSVANLALARAASSAYEASRGGAETGRGGAGHSADKAGQSADETGRGGAGQSADEAGHGGHEAGRIADEAGQADGGLGWIEQAVVDGHPLHPCCRTRGGMSVADVLAYAPEHRPVIRLRRLRVPAHRWYGDAPPVLYAHPWQAERLRDAYPWLTDDGETGPARPLMSLRTVAPLDGGDHVKTAVDIQMTSAIRTVSPAAVHNGPRLSALLRTLTADLPLRVLAETAAGAVIVDGVPQRRLAHLRREAPRVGPGEVVVPLAALGVVLDATVDDPYAWWENLSLILWPALLAVLDRGVALEAHGQNTLVVLAGGRPVRILYRDFGGVRVSAARLRAAGVEAPPLHGDLPSDDPHVLRTKLAAAALGTVAGQVVTLLERRRGADPARLWRTAAAAIRGTGTTDAAALLRDPLPIKATTAMRLAADPLDDIWAYIDNPMAAYA